MSDITKELIGGCLLATRLPHDEAERRVEAGQLCRFCYLDDSKDAVMYLDKAGNLYVSHLPEKVLPL